jgi:hypothetical protein
MHLDTYKALIKQEKKKKGNKFNARKVVIDGITFDSVAESERYWDLKLLVMAGEISDLKLQPSFDLEVNGVEICEYMADFSYIDKKTGETVYEDVKGMDLRLSQIKRKLVKALYGIDVQIIKKA